jgi:hypothetical protein
MAFLFSKIRYLIFIALFFNGIQYYLRWKSYSISAKDFKAISAKSADENGLNAVSRFTSELRRRYPKEVSTTSFWVPLSAGGLQLKAQFLYGDMTEYVALFSTAGFDTVGRSGFHWANSTCTVLSGEVSRVSDATNMPISEKFGKGQNFRQGQFESYVYQLKEGAIVTCYGRGFIPASSVWSISGSLANGDPWNGVKLLFAYLRLTFDGLVHNFQGATDFVKSKFAKMEL